MSPLVKIYLAGKSNEINGFFLNFILNEGISVTSEMLFLPFKHVFFIQKVEKQNHSAMDTIQIPNPVTWTTFF